ncbi:MAG: LamG domain-containing protein [Hamadaea sp.]|nr:LamG domain-containing protein [Hamadaea sp.]
MSASSHARSRFRSWHAAALAVAMALAGIVALPAPAHAEDGEGTLPAVPCPAFTGPPSAEDELTAYQYALACKVDVEVMSLRDVDRQVFATPAGLMDARVAVEPYWVKNAAGEWVDIDPSFVSRADGSAASKATVIGITAGAGGGDTFVTATDPDRGSMSLTWPLGALPAPVLSGDVATYPEVRPGIDLAVQAEAVGFSWVLVIKTEEAKSDPILAEIAIGITTDGLTVVEDPETGRIDVIDAETEEVVFEAGQGIMWDSSSGSGSAATFAAAEATEESTTASEPAEPGTIGDVAVDLTTSGITLKPDARMLADDSLTFPIYIDPPFTSTRKAWANVYANSPNKGWTGDSSWPRSGGMRIGNNTWNDCGDGCGLWRSVITLKVDKLKGKYVNSAVVKALQTHTGGCGSYGLELWRTKAVSNGVSWNGVSWLYGTQLQTKSVPSSNSSGGCSGTTNEWVSFDGANVKKRVQSAADEKNDTISFGFRSASESDRNEWRRIQTKSVRLEVTYYIYPPKPDQLELNGVGCRTSQATAPWVGSRTPTLSARAKSTESEPVYLRLRVRKVGADTDLFSYRTPDPVAAYATVNRTLTTSLPDGEYTWSARAEAQQLASVNSGWTTPCHFKVDATRPSTPAVVQATSTITEGANVTFRVNASDPTVNGVSSGVRKLEYSWNSPRYNETVPGGDGGFVNRIASAGRHVLYVRAVDHTGNRSMERTYSFFVGNDVVAFPKGMWRFEGDAYNDTGLSTASLSTAAGTRAYGLDRDGRATSALDLDGGSCLTGSAPIRTDAAFSIAMWVRLDAETSEWTKVLTQGNTLHSAYQIQYEAASDKWYFSLLNSAAADADWISLGAATPAALGQWLHIAATYDPDANLMKLYFNGSLAGSRPVTFTPWNGQDTFGVGCLRLDSGTTAHGLDGAIDSLGIWQGVLSPGLVDNMMRDLPEAAELARWEFRNGGDDTSRYGRDLAIPGHIPAGFDRFNRPGGAVELDGKTCLENTSVKVANERSYSVATWVNVAAAGYQMLVSTMNDTATAGFELGVRPTATGTVQFYSVYVNAAGTRYATYFGDVAPGSWHHVAVSHDHASQTKRFYVDGKLLESYTWSNGAASGAGHVLIGCTKGITGTGVARKEHVRGSLQDVRLWRGPIDANDLTSMMGYPPPELDGRWRLEGAGTDTSGKARTLTFEGQTQFNDGYTCDPDSAIELAGGGSAATAGPAFATDDSFTVSAWVRLDRLDVGATVASAAGQVGTAFRLAYSSTQQKFGFLMMNTDASDATWVSLYGGPAPVVDTWYHLVGVYDIAAGELRFYVSGELTGTKAGPATPWNATGPFLIGAAGTAGGGRWGRIHGAIDDVLVWQGVMPDHVIGQISAAPVVKC